MDKFEYSLKEYLSEPRRILGREIPQWIIFGIFSVVSELKFLGSENPIYILLALPFGVLFLSLFYPLTYFLKRRRYLKKNNTRDNNYSYLVYFLISLAAIIAGFYIISLLQGKEIYLP